ncbi:MAG: DUF4398 domain-containing protein [Desulfobacterales bacterium]
MATLWNQHREVECMRRCLFFFFSVLLIAGCASQKYSRDTVVTQISNAELMISQAKQNGAEEYAPLELRLAEEKLQEAKEALKKEESDLAGRKAEISMEHARLADGNARAEKAKQDALKEQKNVDMLRNEIDRVQKVKP